MRRAVIDIGTNTVKLLVADVSHGEVTPVLATDAATRLGEGVSETGRLSATAIERTICAIKDFTSRAKENGAAETIALTTSAARDATNGREFLDGVRKQCGLAVTILTGEHEAELIFRGVASDPAWSRAPVFVLDVGGGSAEFIQGRAGQIERWQSFPLGAVRLTERFGDARFSELQVHVRDKLRAALPSRAAGHRFIGTGGAITTLARIDLLRTTGQSERVDHHVLSRETVATMVGHLSAVPLALRRQVPGLPPERADIIVAGGAVFAAALEVLGAAEVNVSTRSLRFGALV